MAYAPDLLRNPQDSDAIAYLESLGFSDPQGNSLAQVLAPTMEGLTQAALQEFTDRTGIYSFLPPATAVDIFLDPPGSEYRYTYAIFGLRGGEKTMVFPFPFTSITAIYIGITPDNQVGSLLDPTIYRTFPYNNTFTGLPITGINFILSIYGGIQSIRINGFPGVATQWKADCWTAIVRRAVAMALPDLGALISGGLLRWQENNTSEFLGAVPFVDMQTRYDKEFNRVIFRNRVRY